METCFNYTDDVCYMSSDERRWITKVRKLKDNYPDKVRILAEPEKNNGCIYATVPAKWVKLSPPKQISEETRQKMSERAKQIFTVSSEPR